MEKKKAASVGCPGATSPRPRIPRLSLTALSTPSRQGLSFFREPCAGCRRLRTRHTPSLHRAAASAGQSTRDPRQERPAKRSARALLLYYDTASQIADPPYQHSAIILTPQQCPLEVDYGPKAPVKRPFMDLILGILGPSRPSWQKKHHTMVWPPRWRLLQWRSWSSRDLTQVRV